MKIWKINTGAETGLFVALIQKLRKYICMTPILIIGKVRSLFTDQNIDEFEIVFDFREVRRIKPSEVSQHDEEKVIHVATDSFSKGYVLCEK